MQDDDDDDRRQRENLWAFGFVVLLVIGSIWLLYKYKEYRAASDCELSGRHHCTQADTPDQ
jgi:hypothetical protein